MCREQKQKVSGHFFSVVVRWLLLRIECSALTVAVRVDGVEGALMVDEQNVPIFYCSAGTFRLDQFVPLSHKIKASRRLLRSLHDLEKFWRHGGVGLVSNSSIYFDAPGLGSW